MPLKKSKRKFSAHFLLTTLLFIFIPSLMGAEEQSFIDLFNSGNELFEARRYKEAVNCYQKALSLNPESKECMNNLGVVLKNLGQFSEAEKYYYRAISIDKKYLNPRVNLCILFYDRNLFHRIIDESEDLLKYSPNNGVAYFGKGFGYYKRREYDGAVKYLELALKYKGEHSEEYLEDAQVLLRKSKMKLRYRFGGSEK